MEGKWDAHAQEDHATSYLHLHLHCLKSGASTAEESGGKMGFACTRRSRHVIPPPPSPLREKWSLHYKKKVEGKWDAHAQEEHATYRTVTILSHVMKWMRLIGHSRACVVYTFIFGGGNDSPTKIRCEMTPTYYSTHICFAEILFPECGNRFVKLMLMLLL